MALVDQSEPLQLDYERRSPLPNIVWVFFALGMAVFLLYVVVVIYFNIYGN